MDNVIDGFAGFSMKAVVDGWDEFIGRLPIESLPVSQLRPADTPRLGDKDQAYVAAIAESEGELPPILVHRPTMRVIDGMYRVQAAIRRGEEILAARLYDGDHDDLFALSVRANVGHGMPLTLKERKAAAERLLEKHPRWSDRLIARASGLSHNTVGTIRRRATGKDGQLYERLGRDGKVRPASTATGRRLAAEAIRRDPDASLSEIARQSGLSIGTARDVRLRLGRGESPLLVGQRSPVEGMHHDVTERDRATASTGARHPSAAQTSNPVAGLAVSEVLQRLRRDPAMRLSESGRAVIRLLTISVAASAQCEALVSAVPQHRTAAIVQVAQCQAHFWSALADRARLRLADETADAPTGGTVAS
ncbi:ParB/RepB/Spo0J family partition protein [Nocardia sp. NPDC050710]|uniref:ParB/RepB/Spo0J family partition protein n=1 Tax=Nocardia sp. NPDC050710 TaxID=3157220 RepID=UPI0033D6EC9F